MRSRRTIGILVLSAFIVTFAGAGCNSDGSPAPSTTGPIDGTWSITSITCGASPTNVIPAGDTFNLIVQNTTGSVVEAFSSDGCVSTEGQTFTYPSSTTYTSTATGRTCSAPCSAGECTTAGAGTPYTNTYALSGTTLTFNHAAHGSSDPCAAGVTTYFTGTKVQ
jgi:hypothetical protein